MHAVQVPCNKGKYLPILEGFSDVRRLPRGVHQCTGHTVTTLSKLKASHPINLSLFLVYKPSLSALLQLHGVLRGIYRHHFDLCLQMFLQTVLPLVGRLGFVCLRKADSIWWSHCDGIIDHYLWDHDGVPTAGREKWTQLLQRTAHPASQYQIYKCVFVSYCILVLQGKKKTRQIKKF